MIIHKGYSITVKGENIKNFENRLETVITFHESNSANVTGFTVNDSQQLPGKVLLRFSGNIPPAGKYVYLYNIQKEKYELLNSDIAEGELEIDQAGKYLIADKKILPFKWNVLFIILGATVFPLPHNA